MKTVNTFEGKLRTLEFETSQEKRGRREAQVLRYQAGHPEEIYKTRRDNLLRYVDAHGTTGVASMLGYRQPSFISQMTSENWNRVVTERSARNFETKLGLKPGALAVPIKPIENTLATTKKLP